MRHASPFEDASCVNGVSQSWCFLCEVRMCPLRKKRFSAYNHAVTAAIV